jgi:CRISPR/Cas system-associated endoribonuclease Cas2
LASYTKRISYYEKKINRINNSLFKLGIDPEKLKVNKKYLKGELSKKFTEQQKIIIFKLMKDYLETPNNLKAYKNRIES